VSKVTSKLQVTLPKALADRYSIKPGDEIEWEAAADTIRVIPPGQVPRLDVEQQLALFDQSTERQRRRERGQAPRKPATKTRGWTRDDLYDHGSSR
jgi:AbrB family looped-hinge helix DNA binding protein